MILSVPDYSRMRYIDYPHMLLHCICSWRQ
jgi:hypothetical protein